MSFFYFCRNWSQDFFIIAIVKHIFECLLISLSYQLIIAKFILNCTIHIQIYIRNRDLFTTIFTIIRYKFATKNG